MNLMGTIVTVNKVYISHCDWRGKRNYHIQPTDPRAGWVVGVRTIKDGEIDDEGTFVFGQCYQCLLVAFWPTMKPVYVPLDGYELGGSPYSPTSKKAVGVWSQKSKDEMRHIMENWPRNEKGQWVAK